MAKMTAADFVAKAIDAAKNHKTLYVMGCFGAPMNATNKKRYTDNNDYNRRADRTAMIKAASADTFGFDCICLIKGILWGWSGDTGKIYGGAGYGSNGVGDYSADGMITICSGVSTNFENVLPGEMLWKAGHAGIYIGDGLAVECTPIWANKVQITAVENMGAKSGYNARSWTKHGKLPYVDYSVLPSAGSENDAGGQISTELRALVADAVTAKQAAEAAAAAATEKLEAVKQAIAEGKLSWREQMAAYRAELQDNDAGKWSEAHRAWAIAEGMIAGIGTFADGSPNYAWGDFCTREQMVTFLHRLAENIGAFVDGYMNDWLRRNTVELIELRDTAADAQQGQ